MSEKPPLPPFTLDSAKLKVRRAEDAWNTRDPSIVVQAYTEDTHWRNRSEIFQGRENIRSFLQRKWDKETDYRLIKELWAFSDYKIAVRFQYEWRDQHNEQWYRAYGNENWQFAQDGRMCRREASINDIPIAPEDRRFHWPLGPRPLDHPGLIDSPE